MNLLKRLYVRCHRFRYRKGHGVHSPFAFGLITDVIEERRPFYAYKELEQLRKSVSARLPHYSERVDCLLFRLVNHFRPMDILEVGTGSGVSLCYLAAARRDARCVSIAGETVAEETVELVDRCKNASLLTGSMMDALMKELDVNPHIGLLHVAHTDDYRQVFEACVGHVGTDSLFVIEGIHEDGEKRKWWQQVVADERTRVTFDLYEVGLVFFDTSKHKQHYVVSF